MEEQLASLLSSGDVDSLRRMVRQGDGIKVDRIATKRHDPVEMSSATTPFVQLALLNSPTLRLRSVRTMGKLLWPAGHAVGQLIAQRASGPVPPPSGLA